MGLSLKEYFKKESNLKTIDEYVIFNGIPIWRIIRTRIRNEYINSSDKTVKPNITLKFISNILLSFIQLVNFIIRRKKVDNVIFPHPRLFKVGDKYIERLSDPLIDYSNIGNSYIIFERWQNGIHQKPRSHSKFCKYWDFIPFISLVISKSFGNLIVNKYKKQINNLITELSQEFEITDKIRKIIKQELSYFIVSYIITSPILKTCGAKRVFMAPRSTFNYVIALGKKNNITSYELQHGIVLGQSKLYSGNYHKAIDPDYFLTFGKDNISNYFGMPIERIINIGYAYGYYLKNLQNNLGIKDKRILVISEPQITEILLQITIVLANKYPDWYFDFRCHPQEALNMNQKQIINTKHNIQEVSNVEESFSTVNKYEIVIGENSSVLFEALFLGKRVGRINYGGLKVATDSSIKGGFIINSVEDFDDFINQSKPIEQNTQSLYSEFKPEVVNNLD